MLPLCLPHLRPLTPFLLLKEVLFSQVVFSPPPIPPPPPLSLSGSPAENDSQSIFTLWSSPMLVCSTHFSSPVFNSLLLFFHFSSLSLWVLHQNIFNSVLEEAHLHDEEMENIWRAFYWGKLHHLPRGSWLCFWKQTCSITRKWLYVFQIPFSNDLYF